MTLTIQLPDELGVALQAQAQAQGVSTDHYVSHVLERTLTSTSQCRDAEKSFETGYGMWAQYGPAPSAEEIDENRRDMFHHFAQDF